MKRIHRVFYPGIPKGNWTSVLAAAVLMAGAAVALTAWQPQSPQPENSPESAFSKWLDQDVVYIISDQERAAFEKLATDPERTKFIEQFWLRRDPTPGTGASHSRMRIIDLHPAGSAGKAIEATSILHTGQRMK